MYLAVLGTLVVTDDAGRTHEFARRERRVLELLAARAPRPVPAHEIIEALWPENPPASAANQVQGCCSRIRRALTGPNGSPIVYAAGTYRLSDAVELDLERFRTHVREARAALAQPGAEDRAEQELAAALELWRGDPFPDALPGTHPAGLTPSLKRTHTDACEQYWGLVARTDPDQAIAELERMVALNPMRESTWAALISSLAAAGRRAEALSTFARLRHTLRETLGVHPPQELLALHEQILRGESLRAAPAATAENRPEGHLPPPPPTFVGRQPLLARIDQALTRDGVRVVLHGRSGIGTSALAVHAAHQVGSRFGGGVFYVNAHGGTSMQRTPGTVLEDLLAQAGRPRHDIPTDEESKRRAWATVLRQRRALVVVDGAPDQAFTEAILPAGVGMALVTSSRPLRSLPQVENLAVGPLLPSDSVELLRRSLGPDRLAGQEDRARAVAEACGHDPTALHLVCSKLRSHPGWDLGVVLDQLRSTDLVLPHLAASGLDLRAGIESVLEDLPTVAREAFDLLPLLGESPFPGWTIGALVGTPQWFGVVDSLVEAHLLIEEGTDSLGQPRYTMQTLTRAVARARGERGDPAVLRAACGRLVRTWWALAHRAVQGVPPTLYDPVLLDPAADEKVPEPATLLDAGTLRSVERPREWLRTERHGLSAAVELAAEHDWPLEAAGLTGALLPFYDYEWLHGDWGRTTGHCLAALDRVPEADRTREHRLARARIIRARAHLQMYQARHEAGESLARQALELFTAEGDDRGADLSRLNLVTATRELKRHEEALQHALEAQRSEVPRIRSAALSVTGGLFNMAGRHAEAVECYDQAVADAVLGEDDHRLALAIRGRGIALSRLGKLTEAVAEVQRSIGLLQEIEDPGCVAQALRSLSSLREQQGDLAAAEAARQEFEAFYASVGRPGTRGPYDATTPRLWTAGAQLDRTDLH
ncbi:BTAD domain-containing putative transcriptional regulator [Kytococcus sedentarius]|uniref:AfsR/SARP family transcriptional regulator n=1 Tax=Kytococcus sedentarius TaxID=1276 RepID=UPI00384C4358